MGQNAFDAWKLDKYLELGYNLQFMCPYDRIQSERV